MNILHLIGTLDPAKGGPPAVVARLAAAQAAMGHHVRVLSQAPLPAGFHEHPSLARVPGLGAARFESMSGSAGPGPWGLLFSRRLWDGLLQGGDVAHLHGVWEPALLGASRAARRRGLPYAVAPHGMLDPWSLSQRRLKKRLALGLGYRTMLARASFLHVLNKDEEKLIAPLRLPTRCVVIPNGVFLEEIDPLPEPGAFGAAHRGLGGRRYILFLGRLHYKKGLDVLADAFGRLAAQRDDIDLVVAGPVDGAEAEAARADFQRRIAALNLTQRVHLTGPIYGDDKLAALADAACFCLPSRQEGFSMAILEAMACGTAVVVTDACHFPEVADCGAGEVTPCDAAAVADALGRVVADDQRRRRMGQAGRELVRSRFTWPRIAQLSIDAYAEFAGGA
jgi:glycosyltransferase involved in cell wall biosynthesis